MSEIYQIDESHYYVYEHWLNGQVIYVGKGRGSRAVELRRNNYWKETVKDDFFNLKVVIKAYFKDEKDTFDYEKALIHRHLKNNQPLTNIEYGNIEPGFGYETKNTKKEINIKVMNEMRFFKESEVTKIVEKNIKNNGKVILFSSGFNRSLIHLLERINNVKLLELSISETRNAKSKNSFIEKGIVPEPYNVIIFPTEIISLSRLEVVDEKVKSVIINDKFIDKSIVLQKINKDLEFLYLKRNPKVVMNKTINHEIVKEYSNRQLTASDKSNLCEELDITNTRGTSHKRWTSVKIDLKEFGYKIEDKSIRIDGKQFRVSTIIAPEFIDESIVLQKINKDLEFLYPKKNPKVLMDKTINLVMNKTINPDILKGFLNRHLTTSEKKDLCKELNIANKRGTTHKRWVTIKESLEKSGYKIEEESIRVDGKQMRVSTIIAPEDIDKSIVPKKTNKDLELLYLKKSPKVVMNKTINPDILKGFLNKQLTTSDKNDLCEELNIINDRGTHKRWVSIKGLLKESGYKIKEEAIRVDGKQMRVSTIIAPEDNQKDF